MTQPFSLRTSLSILLFIGVSSFSAVSMAQSSSCPADINGDGEVNLLDAIEYQNIHGTGTTNIEALTAFINAYPLGCDPTGDVILSTCAPDETGTILCEDSEGPQYKTELCSSVGPYENFGMGGDIAGKCMVVSSEIEQGEVFMFIEENGIWKQIDISFSYDNASSNSTPQPGFGLNNAIKLTSDYLFIGAPKSGAGSVYVYKRNADQTWPEAPTTTLTASNGEAGDFFGTSIDVKGDYLIIGAPGEDGIDVVFPQPYQQNSGAAYLYKLNGDTWTFEKKWKAPMTATEHNRAIMGYSVALDIESDGDVYAYAGAPQHMYDADGNQIECGCSVSDFIYTADNNYYTPYGAVYTLKRGSENWQDDAATVIIQSSQNEAGSWFGYRVDARNGRLAVSSKRGNVSGTVSAGYVEVFTKSTEWNSDAPATMFAASSPEVADAAGTSIQIVGNNDQGYYLAVGVINGKNDNDIATGRVDLYRDADGSGNWDFHQNLHIPNISSFAWFGGNMLRMDEEQDSAECGMRCVSAAIREGDGAVYTFRLNTEGYFVLEN